MTKKLFRNALLFITFVLGGFFLNSCSDLNLERPAENTESKTAPISFAISGSVSDFEARTVLPNSDDHDLKKYLYLYNYTLTYVNENGEDEAGEEIIICNDFSYDKFIAESTIRLATKQKYRFNLKAKDGAITRMEGSSIITLGKDPSPQTVTIVLVPAGEEYGQKLRVDWVVPDDGVITTMKAGISPKRGYAESQTEEEIRDLLNHAVNKDRTKEEISELVEKFKFHEYSFSIIDNPFAVDDPRKAEYGNTVKRIGVTYDDVKTGVARWLDYKFYDANGILVYESSESVYMIGGKTSSTVIYITPDHYYRRPVTITVNKDGNLWKDPNLELKLVDKDNDTIFYIFKPVIGEDGKPTGEFEGLLPGASSGDGTAATDGIFDIYVGLEGNETSENDGFIKTGAEYDANKGKIAGNGGEGSDAVELKTVAVPEKGVTLTPIDGVVGTGTDGSGKPGLIVPAGQDFTVKVELEPGYGAGDDGKITIGGKEVSNGKTVTLNADDVAGGITLSGVSAIEYRIVYKSDNNTISFLDSSTVTAKFTIEVEGKEDIELPKETNFADGFTKGDKKIGGWWFGKESEGNIIHKLNAEKSVREKLIETAVNNEVILNVYWIPVTDVEYKIVYEFEDLGSDPVTYSEDKNIISFHNVSIPRNVSTEIEIPKVPGFTSVEIDTDGNIVKPETSGFTTITLDGNPDAGKEYITKEIHYNRKSVTITLDGNNGNWTDGKSTYIETLTGKYGESHDHIADPVREDFRFLGWYVKGDTTQTPIKHVDNHTFPATDMDYVAKWEQTHANYTVEFYYEDADSTAANPKYTKTSTHTVKGAVGSFPAFNTTPQPGFTFNDHKRSITAGGKNVNEVTVEGTVVKLYFDRKIVEFTLKANGGKFTDGKGNTTDEIILEGKYGTPLGYPRDFLPQPPVLDEHAIDDGTSETNDFTFEGWHVKTGAALEDKLYAEDPDSTVATFPAENAIYAARWIQHNGIYTVVHWAETLDNKLLAPKAIDGFSGKMLEGSVTKKGKLDNSMVYDIPTVTGFEAQPVEFKYSTGTITADGKAETIITYLRKNYTIKFHLNAGGDTNAKWVSPDAGAGSSETVTRTGKYRTDFTPPANPVREHFIFRGWTTKSDGTLDDRVDVVPSFTDPAIDKSPTDYYAVWYSKASGGLETDTADISLVCVPSGDKITANVVIPVGAGEWTYSWTINNVPSGETTDASLSADNKVLTLSNCLKKDYEITVVATHDGKVYTKTEVVTVR